MKRIETKDIIRLLPFDSMYKLELLENFDTWDADQKLNIEEILWNAYDAYFTLLYQQNIQLGFLAAEKNEEKLDDTFYPRMRTKTNEQIEKQLETETTEVDLSAARQAMEKIVKEINASRKRSAK